VQGTSHDVQILGQFLQASIHQQANSVAKRIKTNDMWQKMKKCIQVKQYITNALWLDIQLFLARHAMSSIVKGNQNVLRNM
jgi:hypothetical protein